MPLQTKVLVTYEISFSAGLIQVLKKVHWYQQLIDKPRMAVRKSTCFVLANTFPTKNQNWDLPPHWQHLKTEKLLNCAQADKIQKKRSHQPIATFKMWVITCHHLYSVRLHLMSWESKNRLSFCITCNFLSRSCLDVCCSKCWRLLISWLIAENLFVKSWALLCVLNKFLHAQFKSKMCKMTAFVTELFLSPRDADYKIPVFEFPAILLHRLDNSISKIPGMLTVWQDASFITCRLIRKCPKRRHESFLSPFPGEKLIQADYKGWPNAKVGSSNL